MPDKKNLKQTNKIIVAVVVVLLALIGLLYFWLSADEKAPPPPTPSKPAVKTPVAKTPSVTKPVAKTPKTPALPVKKTIKQAPVIDYDNLAKDKNTSKLVEERKSQYGVEKTIDIIAKPEETVKIRGEKIPMQDIADQIRIKEGGVVEKGIDMPLNAVELAKHDFGIHVVKPGDNIWALHFKMLKNYFAKRGLELSPMADEPKQGGKSTGIGKLLKFSEKKVYVYNIRKKRLEVDLNLIHPNDKIIIYNMSRVFELLDEIDYTNVDRIHFDGETIWIPAKN